MRWFNNLLLVGIVCLLTPATLPGQPFSISISPSSGSLKPGESIRFEASVTGTNLPGVSWQLTPSIGTLVDGLYTAPAIISTPQAVTVIARSLANPAKTASATVWLASAVGIAMTPSSATVNAGQSVRFNASIAGTLNGGVLWSLVPSVGTITDGLYTAPVNIETIQTILLTVASLADPTKFAQASITLMPSRPTSISITPTRITLGPNQRQQFTATVQGGSASLHWSLNPMVGSISPSGLYTPPSAASDGQEVVVTAAISSDPTKSASAVVTLTGPTPPPPLPPIQLPVEVIGLDGMTSTVSFNIPQGSNLSGPVRLSMQIHGLRYQTQASVQINNSGWIPINDGTVTLLGNANVWGGIGGGFATLQMTMVVPLSAINIGANTMSFRFNGTDGRVSGFRVLKFNLLAGDGSTLLPAGAFVYEDPNTWQPPSSLASDIAAGKTLWSQANLTAPTPQGPMPIQAKCSDCHAQDGRDLKYFNYSNNSIRARSLFHGLTAQQGDQIASYIRTINVANPGRPWNPPYQPGPGLDSKPVSEWSAGAGLDAVVDNDQQMLNDMFPSGIQDSVFSQNGHLNVREIRIQFQLPDWNQWLPGIHPIDAFGSSAFLNSQYNTVYRTLRANLRVGDAVAYTAEGLNLRYFVAGMQSVPTGVPPQNDPNYLAWWTLANVDKIYSLQLLGMVKSWEIMNEFQLEGFAPSIFGPLAEPRAWYSTQPFASSPHLVIPQRIPGIRNGKQSTADYVGMVWWQLQLILNNSNHHQAGSQPVDWGYLYGMINAMGQYVQPQAALHYEWLITGLQVSNNGIGPEVFEVGYAPVVPDLSGQVALSANLWQGVPQPTRIALSEGIIRAWLAQVTQFTPQQFYALGQWARPTELPVNVLNGGGPWVNRVWFEIPRYRYLGVNQTLINQMADWAKTIWPLANWDATKTATCTLGNNAIVLCSTDQ